MKDCPVKIYQAQVIAWAIIGSSIRATGNTNHSVSGQPVVAASGLAICLASDNNGFYLFYCDSSWEEMADTWHQTLEGAKSQAEFEYEGVTAHWQTRV